MKRVTITHVYDFDNDTPDDDCYASAIEQHAQEELNDDHFKLEIVPDEED